MRSGVFGCQGLKGSGKSRLVGLGCRAVFCANGFMPVPKTAKGVSQSRRVLPVALGLDGQTSARKAKNGSCL